MDGWGRLGKWKEDEDEKLVVGLEVKLLWLLWRNSSR